MKLTASVMIMLCLVTLPGCSSNSEGAADPGGGSGPGGASGGRTVTGGTAGASAGGASGGRTVTGGTAGTSTGGASSGGASSGGDGGRSAPGDAGSSTGGVDSGGESVPGPLTGFTSGVRAASNEAVAVYPNACAAAVPPLRVLSPADVTLAITEYVGGVLGVPLADLDVHPNACGGPASATCANIFGHDLGGLGGPLAQKILPLAERIDQEATEVVMLIVVPTRNGLVLPVVRVLAGIRDGWLMAIAAFANADTCGAEPG